ncbi:MAG: carbamoyltransferase HypF [Planctomycetes bacterium]|nr:carbamoyltransferase HypF [Planctomycetota bacterium]
MQGDGALIRRRLACRGVVQGVGFRPAVFRLAQEFALHGFVRNDPNGACIEVQGPEAAVAAFVARLRGALPPLARLHRLEVTEADVLAETGFTVAGTAAGPRGDALVPPDAALCAACRRELDDPRDRRHQHPFATCTDCGPRFSLVRELPYDRARTAMGCFPLCPACAAEYGDPGSRRFHAEPICCPQCGPRLWFAGADGERLAGPDDAIAAAQQALAQGLVVALKGLGGFQLGCRADDEAVVAELRRRKHRPSKPLALMVRDLATAQCLVELAARDEALLQGAAGPIVLAPARRGHGIAAGIAPGVGDLGVMLPTAPLHVELFRAAPFDVLVMTSGNRSDEPICLGNREALARLRGIADRFLLHDRDVVRRVDDSVVRSAPVGPVVVRRSRGYVPAPLGMPVPAPAPVLALGGHLQNTVCLGLGAEAFVSQHVGDLDTEGARAFQREVAAGLEQFLDVTAAAIACDTHPDYPSTWFGEELARARAARLLRVPHHLAHAAAVLGEHGAMPGEGATAAALVLDGTGHGPTAAAWGAELLVLDGRLRWARAACGEALPLVGGEAAVREPWRLVAAVLGRAGRADRLAALPVARLVPPDRLHSMAALARSGDWPLAHGAGRLFEALGALLGLLACNDYEGEAAARGEALAAQWTGEPPEPWPEVPCPPREPGTTRSVAQAGLLLAAADRLLQGEPPARVARGLHRTYAHAWAACVSSCLPGLRELALGGGCCVNRFLGQDLDADLAAAGIRVLAAGSLPPGDGGLAYGQAVVAATALARGAEPTFVSRLPEG